MPLPGWVIPVALGGLSFLSDLFSRGKDKGQYVPMPLPPMFFPNPVLYNLGAINSLLGNLAPGIQLTAPPGFRPNLPIAYQMMVPPQWADLMRQYGYGQWQSPPWNIFDALFGGLMSFLAGQGIMKELKG